MIYILCTIFTNGGQSFTSYETLNIPGVVNVMPKVIELKTIDEVISNVSLIAPGIFTGADPEVVKLPLNQRSFPMNRWYE